MDIPSFDGWTCPLPLKNYPTIVMGHGAGGRMMNDLIRHLFAADFHNELLAQLGDSTALELSTTNNQRFAFSTDSFVVSPLFFPGGDIGELAVNGTVNDLAMSGAKPLFLSAGFILEEGLEMEMLGRISASMARACKHAGVQIAAGDTKVVEKGHGDGVYINTTGIGVIPEGVDIAPSNARPGDLILVSGTLGDHGIAIMSVREGLGFESEIQSDTAPLNGLVKEMLDVTKEIHCLRDATRGGLLLCSMSCVASTSASNSMKVKCRCDLPSRQPAKCSGSIPSTSPTRVNWSLSCLKRQRKKSWQ
jgi:hydrogenase expression/formation protein HypE